ncbi:hypothetical protein CDAR_386321 [Caerostris darwini]|uniref:Uncharacterized protein n=1 Tax=Caerostris darwini TaxID=1538125 RepID=A0AAV4QGW1_9ARAC|nr:hypothetical protein CDAR_386321 [Caerostris darwini]
MELKKREKKKAKRKKNAGPQSIHNKRASEAAVRFVGLRKKRSAVDERKQREMNSCLMAEGPDEPGAGETLNHRRGILLAN